jgi:hypothetical protein
MFDLTAPARGEAVVAAQAHDRVAEAEERIRARLHGFDPNRAVDAYGLAVQERFADYVALAQQQGRQIEDGEMEALEGLVARDFAPGFQRWLASEFQMDPDTVDTVMASLGTVSPGIAKVLNEEKRREAGAESLITLSTDMEILEQAGEALFAGGDPLDILDPIMRDLQRTGRDPRNPLRITQRILGIGARAGVLVTDTGGGLVSAMADQFEAMSPSEATQRSMPSLRGTDWNDRTPSETLALRETDFPEYLRATFLRNSYNYPGPTPAVPRAVAQATGLHPFVVELVLDDIADPTNAFMGLPLVFSMTSWIWKGMGAAKRTGVALKHGEFMELMAELAKKRDSDTLFGFTKRMLRPRDEAIDLAAEKAAGVEATEARKVLEKAGLLDRLDAPVRAEMVQDRLALVEGKLARARTDKSKAKWAKERQSLLEQQEKITLELANLELAQQAVRGAVGRGEKLRHHITAKEWSDNYVKVMKEERAKAIELSKERKYIPLKPTKKEIDLRIEEMIEEVPDAIPKAQGGKGEWLVHTREGVKTFFEREDLARKFARREAKKWLEQEAEAKRLMQKTKKPLKPLTRAETKTLREQALRHWRIDVKRALMRGDDVADDVLKSDPEMAEMAHRWRRFGSFDKEVADALKAEGRTLNQAHLVGAFNRLKNLDLQSSEQSLRSLEKGIRDNFVRHMSEGERHTYYQYRASMATTPEEVSLILDVHAAHMSEWEMSWFKHRDILKRKYTDPRTGTTVTLDAGPLSDFMGDPRPAFRDPALGKQAPDFFNPYFEVRLDEAGDFVVDWAHAVDKNGEPVKALTREARKLKTMAAKEGMDIDNLINLQRQYVDNGNNPTVRFIRESIEAQVVVEGKVRKMSGIGGNIFLRNARMKRFTIQNSGGFEIVHRMDGLAQESKAARMMQLRTIFGGRVIKMGNRSIQLLASKGSGVVFENPKGSAAQTLMTAQSPVTLKRPTLRHPSIFDFDFNPRANAEARDLNDKLVYLLGGKRMQNAIDAKRKEEGAKALRLDGLEREVLEDGSELGEIAKGVRQLLDDMGQEAIDIGVLTPKRIIEEYLPILHDSVSKARPGEYGTALGRLGMRFKELGDTPDNPFFAMVRSGMYDPTELDLVRLVETYADRLYFHKYMKPAMDDLRRVAKNKGEDIVDAAGNTIYAKAGSEMDGRDREQLLEWLDHVQGRIGPLQGSAALWFNKLDTMTDLAVRFKLMPDQKANPEKWRQWRIYQQRASRTIAELYYTNFLGWKLGSAAKNLTQKSLSLNYLGLGLTAEESGRVKRAAGQTAQRTGATGHGYLVRGNMKFQRDAAARQRFADAATREGWLTNFREFMESAMNERGADIVAPWWKENSLLMFRWADMDNRAKVFMAAEEHLSDLIKASEKRGSGVFEELLLKMRTTESAMLRKALKEGNHDLARDIYSRFLVNETQFLYNPLNRATFQSTPWLGLAYIFQTWPLNYAEFLANSFSGGKRWYGKDRMATGRMSAAKEVFDGLRGIRDATLPISLFGIALDTVGTPMQMDLGRWFFKEAVPPMWMQDELMLEEPTIELWGLPFQALEPLWQMGTATDTYSPPVTFVTAMRGGMWDLLNGTQEERRAARKALLGSFPHPLALEPVWEAIFGIENPQGYDLIQRFWQQQGFALQRPE